MNKGTCDLRIEGTLMVMPSIENKTYGSDMIICRNANKADSIEFYRIHLNSEEDVKTIVNYGYPGMSVIIYGNLRVDREIKIIADKVIFVGFSNFEKEKLTPVNFDLNKQNVQKINREKYVFH